MHGQFCLTTAFDAMMVNFPYDCLATTPDDPRFAHIFCRHGRGTNASWVRCDQAFGMIKVILP